MLTSNDKSSEGFSTPFCEGLGFTMCQQPGSGSRPLKHLPPDQSCPYACGALKGLRGGKRAQIPGCCSVAWSQAWEEHRRTSGLLLFPISEYLHSDNKSQVGFGEMFSFQVNIIFCSYLCPCNPILDACKQRPQSKGGRMFSRLAGCELWKI